MTEQEMRLHRCCFTGHRPEKLFLVDEEIIKELEREIKAAIEKGYTTFISGMARGVDIWAAEIVLKLRKKNKELHLICASPYEGFETRWSQDWQKRYKKIIKKADYVKYVSPEYSPACFQIRNEYIPTCINSSSMGGLMLKLNRIWTASLTIIKPDLSC